jgi:tetratricopeptide (TPR) repeat protein
VGRPQTGPAPPDRTGVMSLLNYLDLNHQTTTLAHPMKKTLPVITLAVCLVYGWSAAGPIEVSSTRQADSLELLDKALSYNNRGVSRLEQYDYRHAIEEFQKAVELKPDFVPSLVNLGIAYYYDTNYREAAVQLQAALKIDPREPHAHFILGLLNSKEYRKDEALKEFQQVIEQYPDDTATNYNLGLTLMRDKDYAGAVQYFERVLKAEPRHLSAMYNLGMALMRAGRREEAQKVMAQLRDLKGDEGGSPTGAMGTQYFDEGRFAVAIGNYDVPLPEALRGNHAVRFADVTAKAGINVPQTLAVEGRVGFKPGMQLQAKDYSREWAERNLVPGMGSGAAFLDYNADGKLDLLIVHCGPDAASAVLYRNNGDGTFADVTAEAGVGKPVRGMGAAVGDYNNDGWPDLYITACGGNLLFRNDKNGKFTDVTGEAGVGGPAGQWSLSAAFFDYDHDGDLDLYLCNFVDLAQVPGGTGFRFPDDFAGQPNRLYRNNGNGTFADVTEQAKVGGGRSKSSSLVFMDYNESRDIDFCVVNSGGPLQLYSNNRDGSFANVAARTNLDRVRTSFAVSTGDVNKDGYPDLYFPAAEGGARGRLLINEAGRTFREAPVGTPLARGPGGASWASAIFDYDNDGFLDIIGVADGLYLLQNAGRGEFKDVTAECGLDRIKLEYPRSLALADYDGDGGTDVLVISSSGTPTLLRNEGGSLNSYVKVDLAGLNDNKAGIGSKVEVRAGGLWQKVEIGANCGYLSQGTSEVIFGLGARKTIDAIRILWPTGVLQAEMDPAANALVKINQVDRKGTSCPILYAWNGSSYEFVTDFLGGSAFGSLVAPGRYNATDTDEYILVTSSQLKARDGSYSIKMNNQLEEVIFVDQARLLVVDHPADTQVYPNERLMPAQPFPGYKLFVTKDSRAPVNAMDDHGNDVLPLIREIDRHYPGDFKLLPFKGYAEEHSLILDLGDLSAAGKVVLLMNAWIDYADSTSNLAASQADVRLVPPYLQVVDERGEWVTVVESMGFPAGLPKTMTVDLTGKFRNSRDHRIRITTNMRIYWDQILVDTYAGNESVRTVTLDASSAMLGWGGYPREVSPDGKKPKRYDYGDRDQSSPWKTHAGAYTRFGDVSELLCAKDDLSVIMRHGDEITLDFNAGRLQPTPAGWTRSFLVYAVGFGKDMDINSAYPDTVEPLPFQGMPGYPYSVPFPGGQAWMEYNRKYNTRIIPHIYFGNGDLRTYPRADGALTSASTP